MTGTGSPARWIWWLNLDAERELALPSARAPSARTLTQIAESARRFAPSLCGDEPYLVPPGHDVTAARRVLVWCPTPGALCALARAGLPCPRAPSLATLQQVNDRRFALQLSRAPELSALRDELCGGAPASVEFEAVRGVATPLHVTSEKFPFATPLEEPLRLKRLFGFAGKGQWRLPRGWHPAASDPETQRWLRGAATSGGFVFEPELTLERELSLHGLVTETDVLLGDPCVQVCDEHGAPVRVERAPEESVSRGLAHALVGVGHTVARALRNAGYFGPFGFDARTFLWRGEQGVQLLADLNARFTMGWSVGLGERREAALLRHLERTYGTSFAGLPSAGSSSATGSSAGSWAGPSAGSARSFGANAPHS